MKKQNKKLKTITLVDGSENPIVSIVRGHVTAREFNRAFRAEGWGPSDGWPTSELKRQYWIKLKYGWKKAKQHYKRAVPVTVGSW